MITILTYFVLANRVQITSINLFLVVPIHALHPPCSFSRSLYHFCGRTKQKNVGFLLLAWQDKAMEASFPSKRTPLHRWTRSSESEDLNSREAEFKGLLHGNNSSTKVISLAGRDGPGPLRRDITQPGSGPPGSSQGPSSGHTRPDISPLFVAPRDETTPRPSTPVIQTGTQADIQGAGSGNMRRFRLPVRHP